MEPSALCRRICALAFAFPGQELDPIGPDALVAMAEPAGQFLPGLRCLPDFPEPPESRFRRRGPSQTGSLVLRVMIGDQLADGWRCTQIGHQQLVLAQRAQHGEADALDLRDGVAFRVDQSLSLVSRELSARRPRLSLLSSPRTS